MGQIIMGMYNVYVIQIIINVLTLFCFTCTTAQGRSEKKEVYRFTSVFLTQVKVLI